MHFSLSFSLMLHWLWVIHKLAHIGLHTLGCTFSGGSPWGHASGCGVCSWAHWGLPHLFMICSFCFSCLLCISLLASEFRFLPPPPPQCCLLPVALFELWSLNSSFGLWCVWKSWVRRLQGFWVHIAPGTSQVSWSISSTGNGAYCLNLRGWCWV